MSQEPKHKGNVKSNYISLTNFIILFSTLIILISLISGVVLTVKEYQLIENRYELNRFNYQASRKGVIYSADGVVLAYLYQINKEHVPIEKISKPMQEALIAIEDHRFYKHFGIDMVGTLRALCKDIYYGQVIEGGSTITQQLVRNLFLTSEKTLARKISEILLAVNFERKYKKDQILEMYLNEVYFGNGCYGIESAALRYFGKHASELNLTEATVLAGIPKAPNSLDPVYHPMENRARQKNIINRMLALRMITPEDANKALIKKIEVKKNASSGKQIPYKYPYFTTEVIKQLIDMFGKDRVYNGGLQVTTTLDSRAAKIAEDLAKRKVGEFKNNGVTATNLSLVSISNKDGAVISLIGGSDFNNDQNNLAVLPRQPGSAIKPIHYAGALDKGVINENSMLNASSKNFGKYYVASNMDASVSVCQALKYSINVPAVEVVNSFGIPKTLENLKNFGITSVSNYDSNLAIALGGMYYGIKPIEMAAAYTTFANSGVLKKPYMIKTIKDYSGKQLYQHKEENQQIISPRTAMIMTQILQEVVKGGTGTRANLTGNEAGKTGTTNDSRCLWFVGFTKDISTAVWVGNSNNSPVFGYHGGDLAAPIWREYTADLIKNNIISPPARIYDKIFSLKQVQVIKQEEEQGTEEDNQQVENRKVEESGQQATQQKTKEIPPILDPTANNNGNIEGNAVKKDSDPGLENSKNTVTDQQPNNN